MLQNIIKYYKYYEILWNIINICSRDRSTWPGTCHALRARAVGGSGVRRDHRPGRSDWGRTRGGDTHSRSGGGWSWRSPGRPRYQSGGGEARAERPLSAAWGSPSCGGGDSRQSLLLCTARCPPGPAGQTWAGRGRPPVWPAAGQPPPPPGRPQSRSWSGCCAGRRDTPASSGRRRLSGGWRGCGRCGRGSPRHQTSAARTSLSLSLSVLSVLSALSAPWAGWVRWGPPPAEPQSGSLCCEPGGPAGRRSEVCPGGRNSRLPSLPQRPPVAGRLRGPDQPLPTPDWAQACPAWQPERCCAHTSPAGQRCPLGTAWPALGWRATSSWCRTPSPSAPVSVAGQGFFSSWKWWNIAIRRYRCGIVLTWESRPPGPRSQPASL